MASITIQGLPEFPEGTSVSAYPVSNWNGPVVRTAAPVGSSTETQTVTGGVLAFVALAANTRYVAYALVNSAHKYKNFSTRTSPVTGTGTALEVISGGNLTGAVGLDVTGKPNVAHTGTLTGNVALTITGATPPTVVYLRYLQDGSGGHTLTINGVATPIPTDPADVGLVEVYNLSGTDFEINVDGQAAASSGGGSISQIHGFIGQTYDVANSSIGGVAPATGIRNWVKIPTQRAGIIDKVYLEVAQAGVDGGAVLANCFVGVHNSAGTLIGQSADQTASWKSTGIKEPAITVVAGQSLTVDPAVDPFLIVQFLIGTQSSTNVTFERASNNAARCNVGIPTADFAYATTTGAQTALAATLAAAGATTQGANAWWIAVGSTT